MMRSSLGCTVSEQGILPRQPIQRACQRGCSSMVVEVRVGEGQVYCGFVGEPSEGVQEPCTFKMVGKKYYYLSL